MRNALDIIVPILLALVVYPAATGALNWYLWWDTPEAWDAFAAAYPKRAKWIRALRAVNPHFRKLAEVWRDEAARRSLASSAPLSVVAEKAGAVAVFDSRPTMAPPAPVAPTPLRAVTLTGVAAADATQAQYESARAFVAGAGGFDASARQEIAADVVAEAQRLTAAPMPLVHTAASALHGARWEPANDPNAPKEPA
jgi:hypothetical protein